MKPGRADFSLRDRRWLSFVEGSGMAEGLSADASGKQATPWCRSLAMRGSRRRMPGGREVMGFMTVRRASGFAERLAELAKRRGWAWLRTWRRRFLRMGVAARL